VTEEEEAVVVRERERGWTLALEEEGGGGAPLDLRAQDSTEEMGGRAGVCSREGVE